MKDNRNTKRTIAILQYLKHHTDENHPITMPDLLAHLESIHLPCKRRSAYASMDCLKEEGLPIHYRRKRPNGYYYQHEFSKAEIMVLLDDVNDSPSLSFEETNQLTTKLKHLLPSTQANNLPPSPTPFFKTENAHVLSNIEILLDAISTSSYVSLFYFDYDHTKTKVYRHNKLNYHLRPYAIISQQNRYYCVVQHMNGDLRNFRIDKMDHIKKLEKTFDPIQFQLDDYLEQNFGMYKANATTITAIIDESLLPVLYDRFGFNIIISNINEQAKTLTVNFKASISPTLVGYLLQFYDKITILKPQTLIDDFKQIATQIQNTYK